MIDRPITILQVLRRLDANGAGRAVVDIAEAVQDHGARALIACENGALSAAALRTGAEIIPLPLARGSLFTRRREAKRLEALLAERHVDLVHAHAAPPAWAAWRACQATGTPFITTCHDAADIPPASPRTAHAVLAQGDRVIAANGFIAGLLRQRYRLGDDKLRTIAEGVDPARFDPAAVQGDRIRRLAQDWRVDMGQPTLLLCARFIAEQGAKPLLLALAKLRHADALAILPRDPDHDSDIQNLLQLARTLGLTDRLRLTAPFEDLPAAMMLADIVLSPAGPAMLEAQAMGRIVIAADDQGAGETLLPHETGLLFPPGDAAALAAAIDSALDMGAEARIAWGRNARSHVTRHYTIAAMQRAVLNVYAEVLA